MAAANKQFCKMAGLVHLLKIIRIFGGSSLWEGSSVESATSQSCRDVSGNAGATLQRDNEKRN